MLNITGGGEKLYKTGRELHSLTPSAVFRIDATDQEVIDTVEKMFGFVTE